MVSRQSLQHTSLGFHRSHSGFTILELLIVILILGLLMLFTAPNFAPDRREADQASRGLLADIQLARLQAIKSNLFAGIAFNTAASKYLVFEDRNDNKTFDTATDQVISTINFGQSDLTRVKLHDVDLKTSLNVNVAVILFNPRGILAKQSGFGLVRIGVTSSVVSASSSTGYIWSVCVDALGRAQRFKSSTCPTSF